MTRSNVTRQHVALDVQNAQRRARDARARDVERTVRDVNARQLIAACCGERFQVVARSTANIEDGPHTQRPNRPDEILPGMSVHGAEALHVAPGRLPQSIRLRGAHRLDRCTAEPTISGNIGRSDRDL